MNKDLASIQDLRSAFVSHCRALGCDDDYIKLCEHKFKSIETALKRLEELERANFELEETNAFLITETKEQDEILRIIKEFIRIGFIKISFKEIQNFGNGEVTYYVFINGLQYCCKNQAEFNLLKENFE